MTFETHTIDQPIFYLANKALFCWKKIYSQIQKIVYTIDILIIIFIRPSLRRDVLWYTNVRLSVHPSVSHVAL